jgi:hypothetical protein
MANQAISSVSNQGFNWWSGGQVAGARGRGGDHRDHGGNVAGTAVGQGQAGTLFSALLAALTQAAGIQAGGASGSGTAGASAGGASTPSGSDPTSGSTLAQDLHAFLHDLFSALRQASRQGSAGGTADTTAGTSTPAVTTPAVVIPAATPVPTPTPATTPATVTGSSTAGAAQYGQQGLISALQALLADYVNSQALSTSPDASGSSVSASTLSALNTAFNQLISDLQPATGTQSSSGTGSAQGADTAQGTSGSAPTGTAALQAFLGSFLQDLQNGGSSTTSAVGGLVNTSA